MRALILIAGAALAVAACDHDRDPYDGSGNVVVVNDNDQAAMNREHNCQPGSNYDPDSGRCLEIN